MQGNFVTYNVSESDKTTWPLGPYPGLVIKEHAPDLLDLTVFGPAGALLAVTYRRKHTPGPGKVCPAGQWE